MSDLSEIYGKIADGVQNVLYSTIKFPERYRLVKAKGLSGLYAGIAYEKPPGEIVAFFDDDIMADIKKLEFRTLDGREVIIAFPYSLSREIKFLIKEFV